METIIITIDGKGNIFRVFGSKKIMEHHLRNLGYHPHSDDNHKQNWYGSRDEFVLSAYEWQVIN